MTDLKSFILQASKLEEQSSRGITLGLPGSVLDGYILSDSNDNVIMLEEARLLDAENRPSRMIPDPVVPLANVSWWAKGTAARMRPAEILLKHFRAATPIRQLIPEGEATIILPGMIITGQVRDFEGDPLKNRSAEDLNISQEEFERLRELQIEDMRETYLMIEKATVIMGSQRIPTSEPKPTWCVMREKVLGWTPLTFT